MKDRWVPDTQSRRGKEKTARHRYLIISTALNQWKGPGHGECEWQWGGRKRSGKEKGKKRGREGRGGGMMDGCNGFVLSFTLSRWVMWGRRNKGRKKERKKERPTKESKVLWVAPGLFFLHLAFPSRTLSLSPLQSGIMCKLVVRWRETAQLS